MRFRIEHEIRGWMRVHLCQEKMTCREADILQYYFSNQEYVTSVKVRERLQNVTICYSGDRERVIDALREFHYEQAEVPDVYLENTGREMNQEYWDKLVNKVVLQVGSKIFIPWSVRSGMILCKSVKYIWHGIRTLAAGKIEVPVLDGTAIGVSILRGDLKTASSVMFLLGIGEILEDWTHKKSVDDLARSMSLNAKKVWLLSGGEEVLADAKSIQAGDQVVVHMGNVIPFDGIVTAGEAMVNQASLTGESVPVAKSLDKYVYAGTVLEEGELTVLVKEATGSTKFEKIVTMIEETEKLKSSVESQAEHLADKLVPYTLLGTGLVYLLTRNVTKALSVLMVDFSCALKLAMPITVLSALREANQYNITVKGGKFLEAIAQADTIIFDKTGTLTRSQPAFVDVIPFCDESPDELLSLAACLEEHFPHSMAKAVVQGAKARGLDHEEKHSKINYIVAHGISTMVEGKKVIIGSHHFVFEDEACVVPGHLQEKFDHLIPEYSHLYMAVDGVLAAVLYVEDPLREEAKAVVETLKGYGLKVVMMTGDSDRTARSIAQKVGVDEYYAEVLPEDKAKYIERERLAGHKVIMLGDGINDSPALSAADAGIAVSDGAEIAREIADITIAAENLFEVVTLKNLSDNLMKRVHKNYRNIVGINGTLIALGVCGIVQPTVSALIHNTSTLVISLDSMKSLKEGKSIALSEK